jgi:hypothetical protein
MHKGGLGLVNYKATVKTEFIMGFTQNTRNVQFSEKRCQFCKNTEHVRKNKVSWIFFFLDFQMFHAAQFL